MRAAYWLGMKKPILSKKDYKLLHHALDILSSDYAVDGDGKDKYRIKMQNDIEKLSDKLIHLELTQEKRPK